MEERRKYEETREKINRLCMENKLTSKFSGNEYPLILTIHPVSGMDGQLSMLEADPEYISPDASMTFAMVDGGISCRMTKTFTISVELYTKLKNLFKNLCFYWALYWHRDILERDLIKTAFLPPVMESDETRES